MSNHPEALHEEWLRKADEDAQSCGAVLKEGAPSTGCFLAQQIAEKSLKAVLVARQVAFPKAHDLLALETLVQSVSLEIREVHEDLVRLNRYYVETRYPGDYPVFELSECQEAYEAALRVQQFVRRIIASSLQSPE